MVHQYSGERNFHLLHYLLAGLAPKDKEALLVGKSDSYRYMMLDSRSIPGVRDDSHFQQLLASMRHCGISDSAQEQIFRLLSGILALGNISFEDRGSEAEACRVADRKELERAAYLLQVGAQELETALTTHKLYSGGGPSGGGERRAMGSVLHDQARCEVNRDSLAKEGYNRLFLWVVNCINIQVGGGACD